MIHIERTEQALLIKNELVIILHYAFSTAHDAVIIF